MTLRTCLLLAALLLPAFPALAQWKWLDQTGQAHFSDMPPPPETPDNRILQRPDTSKAPPPAAAAVSASTQTQTLGARPAPAQDSELAEKIAQTQRQEDAKRKAEEARQAAIRADNCQRALAAQAAFNSGIRLRSVNAEGESVVMDEAARAAELGRLQDVMRADCQ